MASQINVTYMEKDSAKDHLREIRSNKIVTADIVDSTRKVNCMVHQSSYQYGFIRSAINHVYILARVKIPERMKRELLKFIALIKRTLIAETQMFGFRFF